MAGALTLMWAGQTHTFRMGETFETCAGRLHSEQWGPRGTTVLGGAPLPLGEPLKGEGDEVRNAGTGTDARQRPWRPAASRGRATGQRADLDAQLDHTPCVPWQHTYTNLIDVSGTSRVCIACGE